jgi:hypothetical protein
VCVAIRETEPHRFERAALRWLARFCLERRDATLADVTAAALAFERMAERPTDALDTLRRLCDQHRLPGQQGAAGKEHRGPRDRLDRRSPVANPNTKQTGHADRSDAELVSDLNVPVEQIAAARAELHTGRTDVGP